MPTSNRATAGPYTLVIPPNGRATLYEADGAGIDHEVPYGVNQLDALVQFAGEIIRLNAMIEYVQADCLEASTENGRLRVLLKCVRDYQDLLRKSSNVGPVTNGPHKEARLLRAMYEAADAADAILAVTEQLDGRIIFRDHSCWKCSDGATPCVSGNSRQCEYPHARND